MRIHYPAVFCCLLISAAFLQASNTMSWFSPSHAEGAADTQVYADQLGDGWEYWPWSATVNLSNTSPVHSGSTSIQVTYTRGWDGVQFHVAGALLPSDYSSLRFWAHGGTAGGQPVKIYLQDSAGNYHTGVSISLTKNSWNQVDIPISSFAPGADIANLVWQESGGQAQPAFYLDDIILVGSNITPQALSLTVDATANQHAISPYIYGMSFADKSLAAELRLPVNRWGGNAVTRYNWQNDTSNRASDWYFENIANDNSKGSSADQFIDQNRATGTQTLLTVPLIGWTPKSRDLTCGFSVKKYGAQQAVDSWAADCGNGIKSNGDPITNNDPTDTSVAINPAFVQGWINHLTSRYGTASQSGVRFYNLDNEPMLWNSTHRDVHPTPTSYDEMRDRTYAYAPAIKAADPGALTFGPVLWGWSAYFYSALDQAAGGSWWDTRPDRKAHGDEPFVQWYLEQMKKYEQDHTQRILDFLDLHFYPQGSGIFSDNAGSASTQALRLRSTRALWDPTYMDESWIGDKVNLIPRMHDWVNTYYPGTKIAISEYNWGALNSINGALAEAEILGIFGREGLDLAALWGPPKATDPGAFAFRMYRNYDSSGGSFGDTSIQAASNDAARLSIFASRRSSDSALTLVVINKTGSDLNAPITLSHYSPAVWASAYRYSASQLSAIAQVGRLPVTGSGSISMSYPANSITLIVVLPANAPVPPIRQTYLPLITR